MDKDCLKKLVDDPRFIPGIYNYCDRWCERCPKTAQCAVFAIQAEHGGNPEVHDLHNTKFWQNLGETLSVAMELLKESAERFGVGLDSIKDDCSTAPHEVPDEPAEEGGMCLAAKVYAQRVGDILDALPQLFGEWEALAPSLEGEMGINSESWREARDVIAWYQHLIYIKLRRALESEREERPETDDEQPGDSVHTAKVVLIAIDRSMAAWARLRKLLRSHEDDIFDILVRLDRLRRTVEAAFPPARTCLRPGFEDLDRNSAG